MTRAPNLYEPMLALYLLPWLAVFVSPGNILVGGLLGALVGLNVAVTALTVFRVRSCRATAFSRLLGALPAFLAGFVCCVPAFVLVLGTSVAAVFVPIVLPLRTYLLPLALILMAATLLSGASAGPGRAT